MQQKRSSFQASIFCPKLQWSEPIAKCPITLIASIFDRFVSGDEQIDGSPMTMCSGQYKLGRSIMLEDPTFVRLNMRGGFA
jgi:hypothetical protein